MFPRNCTAFLVTINVIKLLLYLFVVIYLFSVLSHKTKAALFDRSLTCKQHNQKTKLRNASSVLTQTVPLEYTHRELTTLSFVFKIMNSLQ